jgi:phosphoglycerol transferase MdoB-like AlkP superfamily enzyme
MNSVTSTEEELLAIVNGIRPNTTDQWETVHVQSAIGSYEYEKKILQTAGFNTVVTADELDMLWNIGEFNHPFGYFDDYALEFLLQYVDNTRARVPKNRIYLGWMTTTTHTPLNLPTEWAENNRKSYVHDEGKWDSVDNWLNAVRYTDDKIKEIVEGFRERGLEDETLFFMYFLF